MLSGICTLTYRFEKMQKNIALVCVMLHWLLDVLDSSIRKCAIKIQFFDRVSRQKKNDDQFTRSQGLFDRYQIQQIRHLSLDFYTLKKDSRISKCHSSDLIFNAS